MEIKDLPQLGEATESDHVVSSISQKTRLISFKNIFEKISFSSLVTTAKNIIGSINELKGRCDTLDTSVSKLNTDLTTKVIIENITVTIGANTDYSYVPYKTGYVLVVVHGTTFAGIYVTGFADTGSNYSVFYNVPSSQTASITLSLMWVKI